LGAVPCATKNQHVGADKAGWPGRRN
jgi:hypothetical protein